MKKYKLIKEYPGSPKVGYITNFDNHNEDWNTPNMLLLEDCTMYPEFWEEVIEKEYEILSICSVRYPDRILTDSNVSTWENNPDTRAGWVIHSIKRISDSEVFTVGDKIKVLNSSVQEIINFEIYKERLMTHVKYGAYGILKNLIKYKKPLFTTEDGVDIHNKDKFYWVRFKNPESFNPLWKVQTIDPSASFIYEPEIEKYFSTKEAAEEYILLNKPCLSYNDVIVIRKEWFNNHISLENTLKELVKQKLNTK